MPLTIYMSQTQKNFVVAEGILGVVTSAGNLLVLLSIMKHRSLHTIPNVFTANLALADLAVGLFVTPSTIMMIQGYPRNDVSGCILINVCIMAFLNVSILMLLALTVERCIAVRFPFSYAQHATIQIAVNINACIWLAGGFTAVIPLFAVKVHEMPICDFTRIYSSAFIVYFQFLVITLIPLAVMAFTYVYIFTTVKRHIMASRSYEQMFHSLELHRRWRKDMEVARMFSFCFIFFVIAWIPINIINCIKEFCPTCEVPYSYLLISIFLSHSNSTVNPFLYAANDSRIRTAMQSIVKLNRVTITNSLINVVGEDSKTAGDTDGNDTQVSIKKRDTTTYLSDIECLHNEVNGSSGPVKETAVH